MGVDGGVTGGTPVPLWLLRWAAVVREAAASERERRVVANGGRLVDGIVWFFGKKEESAAWLQRGESP